MNRYQKLISRIIFSVFALFLFWTEGITVNAEVVEADLISIEEQSDFTVMFSYEGERPEVVFISPSGKEYGEGLVTEAEFLSAHGEGWSTYKVIAAEAGDWRVRCDKKNNEYVDYSFVDEVDGLIIQSFGIVSMDDKKATLSFDVAMGEEESIRYNYTITAILGEDDSAGKELKSGSAYTGEPQELSVDLTKLSSYSGYRFLLEVKAWDGLEMFDSMMSDTFDYTNPNTPVAMDDFKVTANISESSILLDWRDFNKGWQAEYDVVVIADGDAANPVYTNNLSATTDGFTYPVDTQKLTINLYYKQNGALSEPLVKELDLAEGEMLKLMTEEITADVQMELYYNTVNPAVLDVTVNEKSGQYNIDGSGSLYFPLQGGNNTVAASFVGSNNITYVVESEIYRDDTPPTITLYENLDGMTFKTDKALISGYVKNGAQLQINGEDIVIGEGGSFLHEVPLSVGDNAVTVFAKSPSGVGVSRSMNIIRDAGNVITGAVESYFPLLISLAASVVIIIGALIFVRKKDKVKKPGAYKRFAIKSGILLTVLDALCIAAYVYFNNFNTSTRYVELAKVSVTKAAQYVRCQNMLLIAVLVLSGILVLNLLVGLIVRSISKKKKAKISEE